MSDPRICSFLPSVTEIVYALGLGDQLFGVTHECDYPEEARVNKPKLTRSRIDGALTSGEIDSRVRSERGDLYELDFENLERARPDLIFTQELCEVCSVPYGEIYRASRKLEKTPEIVSLDTFTLEDILSSIELAGKKCGREVEARELVASLKGRIERVRDRASRNEGKKVFFAEWVDPLMTSGHWVPELVELTGGVDGFGIIGKNSRRIEWADVLHFAPEYFIVAPCGFGSERAEKEARRSLFGLEGWSTLPAVVNGNVYFTDGNAYFSRPGPRIVDGLEILSEILNPGSTAKLFGHKDYFKMGA